jgi:Protein of unknown function (DUF3300)
MKKLVVIVGTILVLVLIVRMFWPTRHVAHAGESSQAGAAMTPEALDRLLARVALYPDQLLAQMLMSAQNPGNVDALNLWLGKNPNLKGSELQDAAAKQGFDPSIVALAIFPQVVKMMADDLDWTTNLGVAFTSNRSGVFESVQRLRKQASDVGTLKSTPQQEVETRTTSSGESVIVIEPANPQVVYVPQYNSTTVYTTAPTTTNVVVVEDNSSDAVVAGMIGFTAGVAIGATFSNPYYYGPYGWHGGGYMYNDAWDDYYDHREDAREDWMDHREDLVEERGDRAGDAREQRTERQENRLDSRGDTQSQRTDRQENRQENRPETQAQRSTSTQAATQRSANSGNGEARGYSQDQNRQATERSASRSDAFSSYSSGRSERSASQRGTQSRSAGASRSGGSRSRSGGGRRR